MNVLSLFGGIECGRVALDRLWIPVDKYFSSEIDPYAIKITKANYPDIVHIGDVKNISYRPWCLKWKNEWCIPTDMYIGNIHLLIGGSPCQDLSIAKAGWKWLDWEKSWLFYEYVRILKEVRPKYFLLENVASMKHTDKEKITEVLREVYPDTQVHMINSSLVSAQNRKRLYWTNIQWVTQPDDRGILLNDILEDIPMDDELWKPLDEKYITPEFLQKIENLEWRNTLLTEARTEEAKQIRRELRASDWIDYCPRRGKTLLPRTDDKSNCLTTWVTKELMILWQFRRWAHLRIHADQENSPTLTSNMWTGGNNVPVIVSQKSYPVTATYAWACPRDFLEKHQRELVISETESQYYWRKLTPLECERLQTLPDWYTNHVSDSRRYKAIGNGWTVDVIAHILSFIPIYGH